MVLFKKSEDIRAYLNRKRKDGFDIGFVPTMGALHPGHLSLLNMSRAGNAITVCSIFVNPAQFNDPADFEKYPITIEQDIRLLESAGVDILFLPAVKEMYPSGIPATEHYELGYLEAVLDGKYRPGHFQGVCKVVKRLLDIVAPDHLYLGQKDYQQCMVITRLTQISPPPSPVSVVIGPTLRESDGLAMSSRNTRLSPEQRIKAVTIYQTLLEIKNNLAAGDTLSLQQNAVDRLTSAGFKTDYVSIADANTLEPVTQWDGKRPLVALIAAFIGEVRLIDNMIL